MIVAVILSLLGVAAAIPAKGVCQRSDAWSAWSKCNTHGKCISPADMKIMTQIFSMEPTTYDKGREAMKKMIKEKLKLAAERAACIKAGNCKDLNKSSVKAITTCTNGMAGEYPCHNVDLLSFVNFEELGYIPIHGETPAGNDIWVWHDTLLGDTYAIACTTGGTAFVRITDPKNPLVVGFLRTHTGPAPWRDAKVIGDVAYIVADEADHGLQVFDLTQLRGKTDFSYLEETNFYGRFGNSHNIAADVETKRLYAVGCTQSGYDSCRGGLHMISVEDPLNPVFLGCYAEDGYVHDTQCVIYHGPDTTYTDHEICYCFNEDTLTIVDVTDAATPVLVSKTGYNAFYTHQGWVTDDHTIILLDDELDEINAPSGSKNTATYVWDISDMDAPVLKTVFKSEVESIDHNQYIYRGYTFQSNYEAGLRILWLDQETWTLTQTGFFDVYPPSTTAQFRGTWSNYPYNLPMDSVAVMSIDYGMFMVRPNYAAMEAEKTQTRFCHSSVEKRICQAEC